MPFRTIPSYTSIWLHYSKTSLPRISKAPYVGALDFGVAVQVLLFHITPGWFWLRNIPAQQSPWATTDNTKASPSKCSQASPFSFIISLIYSEVMKLRPVWESVGWKRCSLKRGICSEAHRLIPTHSTGMPNSLPFLPKYQKYLQTLLSDAKAQQ